MGTTNPLSAGLLEGAAYLCLTKAATTDLDSIVPGAGRVIREWHHARRRRFETAQKKLEENPQAPLLELGLFSSDCHWAISFMDKAKDPAEWARCFIAAQELLEQHERSGK